MSLSFVSKSIQTSTEDGGFEERPIDNGQQGQGNDDDDRVIDSRPLFEQLRQNRERFEAEQEEYQRSVMRGTLALDEEDAAHLDALYRQRAREEATRQEQTERELAAFRAARADRLESTEDLASSSTVHGPLLSSEAAITTESLTTIAKGTASNSKAKAVMPVIVKRKRRRASEDESRGAAADENSAHLKQAKATDEKDGSKKDHQGESVTSDLNAPSRANGGIGGLLVGYDSSSDDG